MMQLLTESDKIGGRANMGARGYSIGHVTLEAHGGQTDGNIIKAMNTWV